MLTQLMKALPKSGARGSFLLKPVAGPVKRYSTKLTALPLISSQSYPTKHFISFKAAVQRGTGGRCYSVSTTGEHVESQIDDISLSEYNSISNEYLEIMADELEELSETYPQVDAELTQGVLTLTVPPNGTYVINKQPPNKQIWLSSPISGPKRYDFIGGRWITLRDGSSLTELIQGEISQALETEFAFEDLEN